MLMQSFCLECSLPGWLLKAWSLSAATTQWNGLLSAAACCCVSGHCVPTWSPVCSLHAPSRGCLLRPGSVCVSSAFTTGPWITRRVNERLCGEVEWVEARQWGAQPGFEVFSFI